MGYDKDGDQWAYIGDPDADIVEVLRDALLLPSPESRPINLLIGNNEVRVTPHKLGLLRFEIAQGLKTIPRPKPRDLIKLQD
jgi:hypothetical protein